MKFCPQCGQRLTPSHLEGDQRPTAKPETPRGQSSMVTGGQYGSRPIQTHIPKSAAPFTEKNWFERHLNWTMVLAWLGSYLIIYLVFFVAVLANSDMSEDAFLASCFIIPLAVSIAAGQWVLRQKNRSLAWLLICCTWFFLLIENHSFMRDEHGRTAADYDRLVELDPDNADAYHERGDFYYDTDQYGKAIADYSRAIELEPGYTSAYFNRAYAYGEISDYDKAIADYSKAIELDPNDAQAYYNRALDYHNKGEVPEAQSDLQKCIEMSTDPDLTKDARQALLDVKDSH